MLQGQINEAMGVSRSCQSVKPPDSEMHMYIDLCLNLYMAIQQPTNAAECSKVNCEYSKRSWIAFDRKGTRVINSVVYLN